MSEWIANLSGMKWIYLILAFVAIILSCGKESFEPVYDVHEDFQDLVDSFSLEAAKRGVEVSLDNLILTYDSDLENWKCGQCNSLSSLNQEQKVVMINQKNICWQNPQEKELLIFHELGHCLLGRLHVSDTLPNGDARSLMVAGDLGLYAPCRYVFGDVDDCNFIHKRSYYIDELFDQSTPVPSWALN